MTNRATRWAMFAAVVLLCLGLLGLALPAQAQLYSRTFPETGKTVSGALLEYWITHGEVPQLGYPISEPFQEKSDVDGKTYLAQYFERADLELHPENAAPFNVMPALLGDIVYNAKYPGGAPNQQASTVNPVTFEQTGKTLGGDFKSHWEANGGLAEFGYPISNEFQERSPLDGNTYPVQYFERAEFELHPQSQPYVQGMADLFAPTGQAGRGNQVMQSQLGAYELQNRYPNGAPAAQPAPVPTSVPGCASRLAPGTWSGPDEERMTMKGEGYNGSGVVSATTTLKVVCNGAFTGTTEVTSFTAKGGKGPITLATCSAPVNPVANFSGTQEVRPDGLHLLITGGRFTQGTISCKIPLQPNRVEDLTGRTIDPTDIKVETVAQDIIGGSEWIAGAVNDIILQEVYKQNPNAQVDTASEGAWVLRYQR
jgi:hypothetical protein